MWKVISRAISQREANKHENFVRLWSTAMWILSVIYLAVHIH